MNANQALFENSHRRQSAGFFRWDAPGEPIAVHFHLNTVELLERDAIRAGKAITAGILLGRKDAGRQPGLVVENYEPVPQAAWKSTDSPFGDPRQLKGMIGRWQSRPSRRMEVLGFYRSCAPGETMLTEDDLSVLGANAAQEESIFLLIEPRIGQASSGLLFLVRDGAAAWQWNLTPFSRAELARKGGTARPAELPAETQPETQPDIRRSSIREFETTTVEEQPAPTLRERESRKPEKWQWAVGAAVVAILLGMAFFQLRGQRMRGSVATSEVSSIDSDLGLKLDRAGTAWQLSWNPNAPAILNATKGQLIITDGGVSKVIDLNPSDLRGGTIVYSPLSNDAVLKLQVSSDGSAAPLSESVRIMADPSSTLDGNPSAANLALPGKQDSSSLSAEEVREIERQAGISVSAAPAAVAPVSSISRPYGAASPAEPGNVSRQPMVRLPDERLFVSKPATVVSNSPQARRERVPNGSLVPAKPIAPPATASVPAVNAMKAQVERIPVLPAIAPAIPASVSSSASTSRSSRRGGAVQPAQLLSNVNPIYPSAARDDGISGAVELRFKIAANGDVRDVTVVRGPSILAQAAVEAVRNRKYKPARVDGVPTETEANAIFDFRLN